MRVGVIGRFIALQELASGRSLVQRHTTLCAVYDRCGVARHMPHVGRTDAVATEQFRFHAALYHLLGHRCALCGIATEEDHVGIFRFDRGQDGQEIGSGRVRVLAVDDLQATLLGHAREFCRNALSISGAVIDDRGRLGVQRTHGKCGHRAAELYIARADTEDIVEALLRERRVGRHRQHRDARGVVDARCRNGHAGVIGPKHGDRLGIGQLLRDLHTDLRVGLVVFRIQFEGHFLASDHDALFVQVFDGEAGAIFVVFTVCRLRAGQRSRVADRNYFLRVCRGKRRSRQGDYKTSDYLAHHGTPRWGNLL